MTVGGSSEGGHRRVYGHVHDPTPANFGIKRQFASVRVGSKGETKCPHDRRRFQ